MISTSSEYLVFSIIYIYIYIYIYIVYECEKNYCNVNTRVDCMSSFALFCEGAQMDMQSNPAVKGLETRKGKNK